MTREDAIYYLQSSGFSEEQINTIEQAFIPKPCEDAISRQAVDDAIYDYSRACDVDYAQIMEYIDKLPSVTPQPKTGHWIKIGTLGLGVKCPFCDGVFAGDKELYNFCPNCGVDMREVEE